MRLKLCGSLGRLLLVTENLKRKSYQFLKNARAYLRKGRYAPGAASIRKGSVTHGLRADTFLPLSKSSFSLFLCINDTWGLVYVHSGLLCLLNDLKNEYLPMHTIRDSKSMCGIRIILISFSIFSFQRSQNRGTFVLLYVCQ